MADERDAQLRAIQDALDVPPEQGPTRNINRDVHAGGFPQRPYHRVEDRMASISRGYMSYDEIPAEAGVYRNAAGDWVRRVMVSTGNTAEIDGTLHVQKVPEERPVALTLDMAKASRADFYSPGLGWIREGRKPELDPAVLAQGTRLVNGDDAEWEPLGPTDQALHRQERARHRASKPPVTTMTAAEAKADAKPAEKKDEAKK